MVYKFSLIQLQVVLNTSVSSGKCFIGHAEQTLDITTQEKCVLKYAPTNVYFGSNTHILPRL